METYNKSVYVTEYHDQNLIEEEPLAWTEMKGVFFLSLITIIITFKIFAQCHLIFWESWHLRNWDFFNSALLQQCPVRGCSQNFRLVQYLIANKALQNMQKYKFFSGKFNWKASEIIENCLEYVPRFWQFECLSAYSYLSRYIQV